MKIDKKLATLILALGMVLSGCGKQTEETKKTKKKTKTEATTEEVVTSTTTHGIEIVEDQTTTTEEPVVAIPFTRLSKEAEQNGAYAEVVQEMIADFKKELPEQVSNIQTYHVYRRYGFAALREDGIDAFVQETYSDDYNINVSEIEVENVYVFFGGPYVPMEEYAELPSGMILVMRVECKIKGTVVETGESVEGTFASCARVNNFSLTVDETCTRIVDHGENVCDYSFLNQSYERIIFDSADSISKKDMTKVYEYSMPSANFRLSSELGEYPDKFYILTRLCQTQRYFFSGRVV